MAARCANPHEIVGLIDQFTYARGHAVEQRGVRVGVNDFLEFLQEYLVRHPAVIVHASRAEMRGIFNSLAGLAKETHALGVAPTIRKIASIAARRADDDLRVNVEDALASLELTEVSNAAREGICKIERLTCAPVHSEAYGSPVLQRI